MGWECGIRATEPVILPEVVKRLASSLKLTEVYSLEHQANGFVLKREDPSWPIALEVCIEEASGLEEIVDGESYIYCLFHIWGEEGRSWMHQMERETRQVDGGLIWFEL
ncbi:hypothetical protein BK131_19450 [Paenibacillus amylolyticus]|uniref:Uncharacterized protein n=1 Tax=Paenibacillus amylolyticus TaxID=1451 RepID=A0A1R1BQX7_PAEAM|nr:hypothetical protein [Paenibacillus amylolyticus]OMF12175.1 hypothetical protein BK131_19450 [Paenibacillus amylolyticus]